MQKVWNHSFNQNNLANNEIISDEAFYFFKDRYFDSAL